MEVLEYWDIIFPTLQNDPLTPNDLEPPDGSALTPWDIILYTLSGFIGFCFILLMTCVLRDCLYRRLVRSLYSSDNSSRRMEEGESTTDEPPTEPVPNFLQDVLFPSEHSSSEQVDSWVEITGLELSEVPSPPRTAVQEERTNNIPMCYNCTRRRDLLTPPPRYEEGQILPQYDDLVTLPSPVVLGDGIAERNSSNPLPSSNTP